MSEAYEIGVELAEQEELSGSLEIISQEFANLDAAIAASNAGILALMGESGTTTVAEIPYRNAAGAAPEVQATRGAPASRAEISGANTFGPSDREMAASPTPSNLGTLSEAVIGTATAPNDASGEKSTVWRSGFIAPHGMSADPNGRGIVVAPVTIGHREQMVSWEGAASPGAWGEQPGAPSVTVETESAGNGVAPSGEDRRIEIAGPGPSRAESAAFGVEAVAPRRDVSFKIPEVVAAEWPRYGAAPDANGVFGGVAGVGLPSGEARRPSRDRSDAPTGERGERRSFEAATAPQMAREQVSGAPGGMFSERAAAPQGDAGTRQDDGRAVVMLDGRLVGEMLSGRMARDAARPGAGTTFFDPRQAPAWTPSGSL